MRAMVRRRLGAACLAALLVAAPGCSWRYTNAPGAGDHRKRWAPCTESRMVPTADVTMAVLAGGGLVLASLAQLGAVDSYDDESMSILLPFSAVLALLHGLAAPRGFANAERCRAAHRAYVEAHLGGRP